MNYFLLISLFCGLSYAAEKSLSKGVATYQVKALIKTVEGKSEDLKGKMVCKDGRCDYILAALVKTFRSSDSNRDLNMLTVLEAEKYPLVSVKGNVAESQLVDGKFLTEAKVTFHGIEKTYPVTVSAGKILAGDFVLDLEAHKIDRPSLLTVKIDNTVPVHFELHWQ